MTSATLAPAFGVGADFLDLPLGGVLPFRVPGTRGPARRSPRLGQARVGQPVAQVRGVLAEQVVISTPLDPYLSLRALANYSALSVRTLRTLLELPPDEALPCYRLPGKILVRRSEFDAWMGQYRSRGRPSLTRALRELGLTS